MTSQYERIRDFIILHFKAAGRSDTPFWNYCRTMEIPQTLQQKIDLFRRCGRIFRFEDELFTDANWLSILVGQNIIPESYDPLVDALDIEAVREKLHRRKAAIRQAAQTMPEHREFIRRYCAAPLPGAT
jgi:tryptophan halogenase